MSEGLNNPASGEQANSTQDLAMLQFTLTASNVEDINFTSLKVASSGTAVENTDVTQVQLFEDVDENGLINPAVDVEAATAQTFSADDGTVTFTVSSQTITQGSSKSYIVGFDLASAASAGETFQVSVLANANVSGTGVTSSSSISPDAAAPVSGGTITISNTGALTVELGDNNPVSTNESTSGVDIPVFQISVTANATENITLNSITVATSGTADESTDITQARLFEDVNNNGSLELSTDVVLATLNSAAITSDNQDLTFNSLSNTIIASSTKNYLVVYDLAGTASNGETFTLSFDSNADMSGTGVSTSNSVSITGAIFSANTKTIATTGSLVVTEGENNAVNKEVSSGDDDVEILQIKLSASSVENITINSITLSASGSGGNDNSELTRVELYEDVDGNGVFENGIDNFLTSSTYGSDNGTLTATLGGLEVAASSSKYLLVIYDLSTAADNNDQFTTRLESNDNMSTTGVTSSSSITPTGAPVYGAQLTVQTSTVGSLAIAEGINNPGNSVTANGTSDLEMLQISLTASSTENISVTSIKFVSSGTGVENTDVTRAELWHDVNGNGIFEVGVDSEIGTDQTFSADDGSITFTVSETITAATTVNYLVGFDLAGTASNAETFMVDFAANANITATGVTSSTSVTITGAPVNGNTFTVSNVGSLTATIGTNTPPAANEATDAQDLEMIQINLKANDTENINVTGITFSTSGSADESTDITQAIFYQDVNENGILELSIDTELATVSGGSISSDNQDIAFSSFTSTILAGDDLDYLMVYDLAGSASNNETFEISSNANSNITATGVTTSSAANLSGGTIEGNTKTISNTGSLTVKQGFNNPDNQNVSSNQTDIPIFQIELTASSVEDITVNSVTLTASGTGGNDNSELSQVQIYEDVDGDGALNVVTDLFLNSATSYASDNGTRTLTMGGLTVVKNETKNLLVLYDVSAAADNNDIFTTRVASNSDIVATGVTSSNGITSSGMPVYGASLTVSSSGIGSLSMMTGAENPPESYIADNASDVEMLQILLNASAFEDITISSMTFAISGTGADNTDVTRVELFRDDNNSGVIEAGVDTELGSDQTFSVDNGSVTFSSLSETISAGTGVNYLVGIDFAGTASGDETFIIQMASNSNISATGVTSSSSITPSGAPITGNEQIISTIGVLTMAAGTNDPVNTNELNSASDLEMLQLSLSANSLENIDVTSISFTQSGTANESTDLTSARLFLDVNSDGLLDGSDTQIGSTVTSFTDNGTITFGSLSEVINASSTENWLLVYNLASAASNSETFIASFNANTDITAAGQSTSNAFETGAPVTGSTKTIDTFGSLSMVLGTNTPSASTEGVSSTDVEMLQLRLTASSVENITVSSISFTSFGSGADNTDMSAVRLYLDANDDGVVDGGDTQISSGTYSANNGTITFGSLTEVITADATENWIISYDFNGAATNGETFNTRLTAASSVTSTGVTSSNSISAGGSFPFNGALKTISTTGSLVITEGANNPTAAAINPATPDVTMLIVNMAASSVENVNVTSISFTASGSGADNTDITSAELYLDDGDGTFDAGDTQIGATQSFSSDNGSVTFSSLSEVINASTDEDWIVVYDYTGSASDNETFISLLGSSGNITATGATSSNAISATASFPLQGGTQTSSSSAPLPVELISFDGKVQDGQIILKWVTAQEINNDYFEVQKSLDGENFQSIGTVQGQGNTANRTQYVFTDRLPFYGVTYYRLKQVDFDKSSQISFIISVETEIDDNLFEVTLFPNPTNSNLFNVRLLTPEVNMPVQLSISDIVGNQILKKEITNDKIYNTFELQLPDEIRKGIYIVTIRQGIRKVVKKLLKY